MADVIRKATNRFTKGLVLDFSPENTQNQLLTHALNATLLTFNGNEMSLQSDMGNGRVETAYLPEGYMPVGACEYGGIIYIVSYNPLEDKSQIGCFPSPERNISSDELGIENKDIKNSTFVGDDGEIKQFSYMVQLKEDKLNPGDKFIITTSPNLYTEKLKDMSYREGDKWIDIENPLLALNVVAIEDSGKIIYLNSTLRPYEYDTTIKVNGTNQPGTMKYHLLGNMIGTQEQGYNQAKLDIDSYRNTLSSGYNVFKSKVSGKLAILAELVTIDSYSVTHELVPKYDSLGENIDGSFYVVIHTEVSPTITTENFRTVPKLAYYHLQESQGYLQIASGKPKMMFKDGTNLEFLDTTLGEIYVAVDSSLTEALTQKLGDIGKFNFYKKDTYHGKMLSYDGEITEESIKGTYTKFTEGKFHRIDLTQLIPNYDINVRPEYWDTDLYESYYINQLQAKLYTYHPGEVTYVKYLGGPLDDELTYYTKEVKLEYIDVERNTKFINQQLWKIESIPTLLDKDDYDSMENNLEIPLYVNKTIISYSIATQEDIDNGEELYTKNENTFESLTSTPDPNETYYIQTVKDVLVEIEENRTDLDQITVPIYYYPVNKSYTKATEEEMEEYWDFEKYPIQKNELYGAPFSLYYEKSKDVYTEATDEQIADGNITIYYKSDYINTTSIDKIQINPNLQYFLVVPIDSYVSSDKFQPNPEYNYIKNHTKPEGEFPKDDPIELYTLAEFIPNIEEVDGKEKLETYPPIKLGSITIPKVLSVNGVDLPFKYDYTITPCMSYGKLDHLKVSNTVDFGKLRAFEQSDFNTWKYRIDGNQLRLTFGADIYDTYEDNKVDGLILEFYDVWGFAGSIEITDKKAYSGKFTKIIDLNTLQALSTKRIVNDTIVDTFKRNINITYKDGAFKFNNKNVGYASEVNGWNGITEEENDCGTLYSNLIYGVKTYLRRTIKVSDTEERVEYKRKKDLFLYTLPIYNDYYYTIEDFNILTNPKLEMMLTYRLENDGKVSDYKSTFISDGYTNEDKLIYSDYISGNTNESSINLTKYYEYTGASKLYLEIGLSQYYNDYNIRYDNAINNYFSCTLQLLGDNSTFSVESSNTSVSDLNHLLNYNSTLSINDNQLLFNNNSDTITISDNFDKYNFITNSNPHYINIGYKFIIGYKTYIDNIRSTQVPTTTVCALYHKISDDNYNETDFGIYKNKIGETEYYMSDKMFYNAGTAVTEEFGFCKQTGITISGENADLTQILNIEDTKSQEAVNITTPGKLNTGNNLKELSEYLGKLAFCQPHAHAVCSYTENGVNLFSQTPPLTDEYGSYKYTIGTDAGGKGNDEDHTDGSQPRVDFQRDPRFNLCLNTKNTVDYNSEFISTLDYLVKKGDYIYPTYNNNADLTINDPAKDVRIDMRVFTGFTAEQITVFNKNLLNTMKSVYAYNPDYDQMLVNIGDVNIYDYGIKFTSSLLAKNGILKDGENNISLNDFVYFGPIKVSDYLNNLSLYSAYNKNNRINTDVEQVKFEPDYKYLGGTDTPYIVTSLTYNLPIPESLENELTFTGNDTIVVKDHEGTNSFLKGEINKRSLYTYNSKKLVELDVSNYEIGEEGELILLTAGVASSDNYTITENINTNNVFNAYTSFSMDYNGIENIDVQIRFEYATDDQQKEDNIVSKIGTGTFGINNSIYLARKIDQGTTQNGFILTPKVSIKGTSGQYLYSGEITAMTIVGDFNAFNDKVDIYSINNVPSLANQSIEILDQLMDASFSSENKIKLIGSPEDEPEQYVSYYLASNDMSHAYIKDQQLLSNSISFDVSDSINVRTELSTAVQSEYYIGVLKLRITSLTVHIEQKSKLESTLSNVFNATKTVNYSNFDRCRYKVDTKFEKAQFLGTSLTINDLIYEPNATGHRLYVKNGCYRYYQNKPAGQLFYRRHNNDGERDHKESSRTWYYDYKDKNTLYIYSGPCFTIKNLNGN